MSFIISNNYVNQIFHLFSDIIYLRLIINRKNHESQGN